MNTLVFFFTLIVVIEVLVIAGTSLVLGLRKSDNFVLAVMGEVVIFVFVWLIASSQVDDQDSLGFSLMAFSNVIALVITLAGLPVIYRLQNRRVNH